MGKHRKVLTAEELVVKQEVDYLKKKQSNQNWRLNNPDHYEYFKTTYMKKYYQENKDKLNAQTKERRLRKAGRSTTASSDSSDTSVSSGEGSPLPPPTVETEVV